MNTKETRLYIIESNYLAAQYIHSRFGQEPGMHPRIIDSSSIGGCRQPIDSSKCLLILDRPTIASALLSWGIKLRSCFPDSHLIVIANRDFGEQVRRIFQRWIVAVVDYADLVQLPFVVARALRSISEGEERGACAPCGANPSFLEEAPFSRREREILELLCLRLSNKEIANRLDIQAGTVKFHVSNIFSKMGLRRRKELFSHVDALLLNPQSDLAQRQSAGAASY
jgi:DNA-binding CsgD family transcriptional regulator